MMLKVSASAAALATTAIATGCSWVRRRGRHREKKDRETLLSITDCRMTQNGIRLAGSALEAGLLPRWFAVYTNCRHEKRVAQHLVQRGIEFYLPLYQCQRRWSDGSRVTLDLPLFPSYLFVHIPRNDRVRVLEVPGALAIVAGTGGEPLALPDESIEALRTGLPLRAAQPCQLLTAGRRARIRSGALAGMEGVVIRNKGALRVVLTLDLIMQSVSVEVDALDLEPVEAEARACA